MIFSLPTFFFLKDSKRQKINKENISSSFNSILQTFKEISKYKIIVRFLIARLFYNDGLITIFATKEEVIEAAKAASRSKWKSNYS